MQPTKPLIITAKMDAISFEFYDEMRRRHFPPERNFLAAHITLFHRLPGEELSAVEDDLRNSASAQAAMELNFSKVRFLGRGTAIEVESPALISLRKQLATRWHEHLTPQDRQKFNPHITVQNKVEPERAKLFYEKLKADWRTRSGKAVGLQLWRYLDGPWELINEFAFKKDND